MDRSDLTMINISIAMIDMLYNLCDISSFGSFLAVVSLLISRSMSIPITFPKLNLMEVTPLMRLKRAEALLGGRNKIFIKRDDLGGIGGGGNKLRKLAYAVAAAREQGCDTLITFGALQSNHARLTTAVAMHCGMRCELVLSRRVARVDNFYNSSGNILLEKILGANLHILDPDEDPLLHAEELVGRLSNEGRQSYVIPFGGSDALGAIGYMECISELLQQSSDSGCAPRHLIHASGSGGTQAGLLMGAQTHGADLKIHGVSVLHDKTRLVQVVDAIADETTRSLQIDLPTGWSKANVDDRFVGEGYGIPAPDTLEAIRFLARAEGVLLDPVYTGKAFAALMHYIRQKEIPQGEDVVFLHTGGLPGLFAYTDEFK